MTTAIPLDEQIVATLTADCTSAQATAVLANAKALLLDVTAKADAADVASLNPLATTAEARKLRCDANDHRFEADRMEASISALEVRLSEIQGAEREAVRAARYGEVRKLFDTLAADIARDYPRIVAELTALAKRGVECDALCAEVGIREIAEHVGRGLPGHYVDCSNVRRLHDIRIQMPSRGFEAFSPSMEGWHWRGLDLALPLGSKAG